MARLAQIATNIAAFKALAGHRQSLSSVVRGVEVDVTETTGVAFLVFGNTGVSHATGLVKEGPKGVGSGVE